MPGLEPQARGLPRLSRGAVKPARLPGIATLFLWTLSGVLPLQAYLDQR